MRLCAAISLLWLFAVLGIQAAEPLPRAHAHNDYLHTRPLLDALGHGFYSVEADIHLVNGELLVAHKPEEIKSGRTLQKLYLDPLRERVKKNGGRVFPNGPEFSLLIDFKTPWTNTYPVLRAVLTNYSDILTTFRNGTRQSNAVTVILSGNRSKKMFANEAVRFAAYDGELKDLDANDPVNLVPLISADWKKTFSWRGTNAMPEADLTRLQLFVDRTHQQGKRLRFFAVPDFQAGWRVLLTNKVDLINTDKLDGLEKFLRAAK